MSMLVVNTGSTSIKFEVFDGSLRSLKERRVKLGSLNLSGLRQVFGREARALGDEFEIDLVVHRLVHGGGEFFEPVVVTEKVVEKFEGFSALAPLHNEVALNALKRSLSVFAGTKNVIVLDSAFHRTMPEVARRYALPSSVLKEHRIERFGFHGFSHQFVAESLAKRFGRSYRAVSCHLGGGTSVCALKNGRSVEVSMGFSPLEGLPMTTRSGSVDAEIVFFLEREGHSLSEIREMLNYRSGLFALAGTADMEKIVAGKSKDARKKFAVDYYVYRVAREVASMMPVLGGMDVLAFAGGIGFGSALIRQRIAKMVGVGFLKKFKVVAVDADEEKMIAKAARRFVRGLR